LVARQFIGDAINCRLSFINRFPSLSRAQNVRHFCLVGDKSDITAAGVDPEQSRRVLRPTTQALKQTSGDPSGQTWNYRGITLLYNFTTALLYMVTVSSIAMARSVAVLLNI